MGNGRKGVSLCELMAGLAANLTTSGISYNQMAGHTCEGFFFFLIKAFDVGRPTSNPDL